DFTRVGGKSANRIAKWNGAAWDALAGGISSVNGEVHALAVYDDGGGPALYVGGVFTAAGGLPAARIAKWDGSTWSALGTGMSGGAAPVAVHALAVFDDGSGPALYAGGAFTTAGGVNARRIAKWNGSSWSGVQTLDEAVHALAVFD